MLKVTIKFIVYCTIILFFGCSEVEQEQPEFEIQHVADSLSEARIDSAYTSIRANCDTMMIYEVPKMVDSFLKDSALLQTFFDTGHVYTDADKKVEIVIRQLQADCDSSLLKETYRRVRLQQKTKPAPHRKRKA